MVQLAEWPARRARAAGVVPAARVSGRSV